MITGYPVGYPLLDPQMDYSSYYILAQPLEGAFELPLTFFIELGTKLGSYQNSGTACVRSSTSTAGALFIPVYTLEMPYSYLAVISLSLVYSFFLKKAGAGQRDLDDADESSDAEDIFPNGLDIYLAVSGVYEEKEARGSTWFYFLLRQLKTVPAWVVPVLSLVVWAVGRGSEKSVSSAASRK